MEINMCCPVCGSYHWSYTEKEDPPVFECDECGELCTVDQMEWRCF